MERKGLSDVVTTVLVILLALAAVVLVWTFVRPLFENLGGNINAESFTTTLNVQKAEIIDGVKGAVVVQQGSGSGKISKVKIVLSAADGSTQVVDKDVSLSPLQAVRLDFPLTIKPARVDVYPVFTTSSGSTQVSSSASTLASFDNSYENLIAYYPFDGDAKDAISGIVGTASSGASYDSSGKFGSTLKLVTADDSVSIVDNRLNFYPNFDFTISVWIEKVTLSSTETYRIVNKLSSNLSGTDYRGYNLDIASDSLRFEICPSTCNGVIFSGVSSQLKPGFNNIVAVANLATSNKNVAIYINGEQKSSVTITQGIGSPINVKDLFIGKPSRLSGISGENSFTGKIDELRIYNRALTADEIKLLAK
jgi:hypothetical protein